MRKGKLGARNGIRGNKLRNLRSDGSEISFINVSSNIMYGIIDMFLILLTSFMIDSGVDSSLTTSSTTPLRQIDMITLGWSTP